MKNLNEDNTNLNEAGQQLLACSPDDEKDEFQEELSVLNKRWLESKEKLIAKCEELENNATLSQRYKDDVQRAQDKAVEIDELVCKLNKAECDDVDELRNQYQVQYTNDVHSHHHHLSSHHYHHHYHLHQM